MTNSHTHRPGTIRWLLVFAALFIANCVLWFNEASAAGLYIDAGVHVLDQPKARSASRAYFQSAGTYADGSERYLVYARDSRIYREYDINDTRNPYGSLSIGYDWRWTQFAIDLQARHQSSMATGHDRGFNALSLSVRWYPFGGR